MFFGRIDDVENSVTPLGQCDTARRCHALAIYGRDWFQRARLGWDRFINKTEPTGPTNKWFGSVSLLLVRFAV